MRRELSHSMAFSRERSAVATLLGLSVKPLRLTRGQKIILRAGRMPLETRHSVSLCAMMSYQIWTTTTITALDSSSYPSELRLVCHSLMMTCTGEMEMKLSRRSAPRPLQIWH